MAKQLQLPTKEHIPNSTETAFNHQLPIKPPSHVRTIAGTQDLQKTTIRQDLENKHRRCYTQNTDRKKSRLNKSRLNSPKPRVPILGLAQTVSSDSPLNGPIPGLHRIARLNVFKPLSSSSARLAWRPATITIIKTWQVTPPKSLALDSRPLSYHRMSPANRVVAGHKAGRQSYETVRMFDKSEQMYCGLMSVSLILK